jgi:predicted nucleic acid-binding protein
MVILDASALYPLAKAARENPLFIGKKLVSEKAAILDLSLYEIVNATVKEWKKGVINNPDTIIENLVNLASLIKIIRVEPKDMAGIYSISESTGLTSYDASYVYYARLYGSKLVTSDMEILKKARDIAIETNDWIKER